VGFTAFTVKPWRNAAARELIALTESHGHFTENVRVTETAVPVCACGKPMGLDAGKCWRCVRLDKPDLP
jgi:hypothetical protein